MIDANERGICRRWTWYMIWGGIFAMMILVSVMSTTMMIIENNESLSSSPLRSFHSLHVRKKNFTLDPIILPIPTGDGHHRHKFYNLTTISPNKIHRGVFLVRTNYPYSVVLPNDDHDDNSNNDDDDQKYPLETTLNQARRHQCDIIATNGKINVFMLSLL